MKQMTLTLHSMYAAAIKLGYSLPFMNEICKRAFWSGRPFHVLKDANNKYYIEAKEAAIQKRSEKITQLQLENQQDREDIRQLKKVCAELQAQEVKRKTAQMQTKGTTVDTDQINRALELLALVGDAAAALSVEQMAQAVQGAASQAAIAADAQDTYENTISSPIPDDSE